MEFKKGKYYSVYDNDMQQSLYIFKYRDKLPESLKEFKNHNYNILELENYSSNVRILAGITSIIKKTDTTGIIYNDPELLANFIKEELRIKRIALLKAFDLWEKAVLRNREKDSEKIIQWYNDLLDLKEDVFENIPDEIIYYMGGN